MGSPGYQAGTLDQLIAVVAGRLRGAAEALEGPNEFDKYDGGRRWPARLAAYSRELYRKVNANPSLRSLPIVGPSFSRPTAPLKVGNQRHWLDRGNIHPYAGGASPRPSWIAAERTRMRKLSGNAPLWATEAGFHNAVHARSGMPPASEAAAAVYTLRTVLEHFEDGIARTYLYELIDTKADPRRRDPNANFGLLRSDYSRKPAFTGLRNLLRLVGGGRPRALRPLSVRVRSPRAPVRHLLLQRADGTYVLALWRLSSVWDRDRRRPLRVAPRRVTVKIPQVARAAAADPIASGRFGRGVRVKRGSVRLALGGRPVLLQLTRK